jgi:hypothetical protein
MFCLLFNICGPVDDFRKVRRAAERPPTHTVPQPSKPTSRHMSARQPFVPSRPASRAVNLGEETRTIAKDAFAHAVSSTDNNALNPTSTEKKNSGLNHLDLEVKLSLPPSTVTVTEAELIHNFNFLSFTGLHQSPTQHLQFQEICFTLNQFQRRRQHRNGSWI